MAESFMDRMNREHSKNYIDEEKNKRIDELAEQVVSKICLAITYYIKD